MTERESYLWTAIAGIATVAATIVAIAIFLSVGPPDESDTGPQVAAFFADNRMPVLIALYCAAIGTGFNLAFYVLLRDVLRRLDAGIETLAALGVAGGVPSSPSCSRRSVCWRRWRSARAAATRRRIAR
jgi:hypothetical protein